MKLIHNWRKCLLHAWSTRFMGLAALLQSWFLAWPETVLHLWAMTPPEARAVLPEQWARMIPLGLLIAAFIARHIKQEKLSAEPKQD